MLFKIDLSNPYQLGQVQCKKCELEGMLTKSIHKVYIQTLQQTSNSENSTLVSLTEVP